MPLPSTATQILSRQHGVIHRAQALSAGLTADQVRYLTRTGAWLRLLPRTYRSASAPLTWETWAFAALLTAGPGGTLIGETAAAIRGLHPRALPICLAVPPHQRLRLATTKISLLNLEIPETDRIVVNGLVTTTRLRTAVDIAHLLPLGTAQQLVDRMLVLDIVELAALTEAIAASGVTGQPKPET